MRLLALFILLLIPANAEAGGIRRGGAPNNTGIAYPWRFAYVTDTHLAWPFGGTSPRTTYQMRQMIDTLNTIGVDFMVWGGDWAEDVFYVNAAGNYDSLLVLKSLARFPWWPVIGNHEALPSDTLQRINPYATAQAIPAVSGYLDASRYYSRSWKNVTFVALQTNCAYAKLSDDYRVNNPTTYAVPTGGLTGYDYDGITVTTSPQRVFLRNLLHLRDKSHWLVEAFHRGPYGTNANNEFRYNFVKNLRTTHFIKESEDSLVTGERMLCLQGDQHQGLWFTKAIKDSAIAGATTKGGYHLIVTSAGATRPADTTECFGGSGLLGYLHSNGSNTALIGRTTTTWSDALTVATDPDMTHLWTWTLCTVYGDLMLIQVFRTFTTNTSSAVRLGGKHRLISQYTISRDVG